MNAAQVTALVLPAGDGHGYLARITPDLATLQGLVGGYVEAVSFPDGSTMLLNEDGKYAGLPLNRAASTLAAVAEVGLMPGDFVVGQAVVLGTRPAGEGMEHDDVPEALVQMCRDAGVPVTPTDA